MSRRLIHFLLIFPRFLPPVPLLLLLTTPPPLPHWATALPTPPPAHLVSPDVALFIFISLLFTPTSSCIYYLSFHRPSFLHCPLLSPTMLLHLPFLTALSCLPNPLISPSSPLFSMPISFFSVVMSVSMSAVCLSHVSKAEPKTGNAKRGPCLTSLSLYHKLWNPLALSQHLLNLKSTPDAHLTDFFVLKGQEISGLKLKVKSFNLQFLSFSSCHSGL